VNLCCVEAGDGEGERLTRRTLGPGVGLGCDGDVMSMGRVMALGRGAVTGSGNFAAARGEGRGGRGELEAAAEEDARSCELSADTAGEGEESGTGHAAAVVWMGGAGTAKHVSSKPFCRPLTMGLGGGAVKSAVVDATIGLADRTTAGRLTNSTVVGAAM
jgi:hypothetical protein